MDRSFLTNDQIIEASRDFVCIRLATYEDAEEAKFLRTIYVGRSGELDNTVFCLLAPDGKKQLCRPGRAPNFAFRSPRDMVQGMLEIATEYPGKNVDANENDAKENIAHPILPQMKNFRLSLNVAECDRMPLVIGVSADKEKLKLITKQLAELAFSEEYAGRFMFATTNKIEDLKPLENRKLAEGIFVVSPGEFGMDGKVTQEFAIESAEDEMHQALGDLVAGYERRPKSDRSHIRKGNEEGIEWETEIPVTDPGSIQAKERRSNGAMGGDRSKGGSPEGQRGDRKKKKNRKKKG